MKPANDKLPINAKAKILKEFGSIQSAISISQPKSTRKRCNKETMKKTVETR